MSEITIYKKGITTKKGINYFIGYYIALPVPLIGTTSENTTQSIQSKHSKQSLCPSVGSWAFRGASQGFS